MEKFVNEISTKLLKHFSVEDVTKIKETIYSTLKDYDVIPKKNDLMVVDAIIPKELSIYLGSIKIEGKQETTLKQYNRELERFLLWVNKPLKDIKSENVRLYLIEYKLKRNISNVTLDSKRSIIGAFFSWLNNSQLPRT